MKSTPEDIDLLDDYIKGRLSPDKVAIVEQRLKADADFKSDYELLMLLSKGARLHHLQKKIEELKKSQVNEPQKPLFTEHKIANNDLVQKSAKHSSTSKTFIFKIISIAASVVVLVALAWVLFMNKQTDSGLNQNYTIDENTSSTKEEHSLSVNTPKKTEDISLNQKTSEPIQYTREPIVNRPDPVADFLKLYDYPNMMGVIFRSDSMATLSYYDQAYQLYKDKKYSTAISLLTNHQNDPQSRYLLAHCYLLNRQSQLAAKIFHSFALDDFSIYYEDACWYYILALYSTYPQSETPLKQAIIDFADSVPDQYRARLKIIRAVCRC